MERLYGYINSINLLSSISLVILWASRLFHWNILSGVIVNNYIALTAMYAPMVLFIFQAVVMMVVRLNKKQVEYYQRASALFSFVNMIVYLLFLAYIKYF